MQLESEVSSIDSLHAVMALVKQEAHDELRANSLDQRRRSASLTFSLLLRCYKHDVLAHQKHCMVAFWMNWNAAVLETQQEQRICLKACRMMVKPHPLQVHGLLVRWHLRTSKAPYNYAALCLMTIPSFGALPLLWSERPDAIATSSVIFTVMVSLAAAVVRAYMHRH